MQEISGAVQEGAQAYLNRQYTIIAAVAVPLAIVLLLLQDWKTALGFVIGAVLSGATGFIGMNVSVRANARVAEAARGGVPPALDVAFKGGSVTGLLVVGLALLGVAGYYGILVITGCTDKEAVDALIGLGFGGSLISVFARLGGGIFTKAADVGADLVGKVEAGIPEDDPRNPAVIADNVGDNVGDCAGMAADLFETYAVTSVAVMLLGVLTFTPTSPARSRSTRWSSAASRSSPRSSARSACGPRPTKSRARSTAALLVSGVALDRRLLPDHRLADERAAAARLRRTRRGSAVSVTDLWLCAVIGIAVTALLFVITDYYTSTRFRPVKTIAQASETGHATNIIQGLAQGFQSTAAPALVHRPGDPRRQRARRASTASASPSMAQLSLCGLIVALDAFGPITDNAGGIAEMAELPEDVRNVTDPLDAVGNTTKAVTKGYAIGSAALAALVLFAAFKSELADEAPAGFDLNGLFNLTSPDVLIGLIIGGMMVYLFSALAIEAVGRAGGQVVEQVRKQFKEHPGIMDGTEKPEYGETVSIVTLAAQKEMILPVADPDRDPGDRRPAQRRRARRPADRRHRRRPLRGDLDDRRRRRLGQRQEADRGRGPRRQGLRGPRGLGHRRHGRRSLQGHGRPGDQPDDQGGEHRRHPDHPDRPLLRDFQRRGEGPGAPLPCWDFRL